MGREAVAHADPAGGVMTENDVLAILIVAAAVVRLGQLVKADRDHKRATDAKFETARLKVVSERRAAG